MAVSKEDMLDFVERVLKAHGIDLYPENQQGWAYTLHPLSSSEICVKGVNGDEFDMNHTSTTTFRLCDGEWCKEPIRAIAETQQMGAFAETQ